MTGVSCQTTDAGNIVGRLFVTCAAIVLFLMAVIGAARPAMSAADPVKSLRNDLRAILRDPAVRTARIGIVVDSLTTGERLFEQNADQRFVPASNMKVFTVAAALIALSPDYTYETRLLANGPVSAGVLRGDLMIVGSGDPTVSGYFNNGDPVYVFKEWTKKLKDMGVREITGGIVIDNSAFSGPPYAAGWDMADALNCYCAPRDAFMFNNNCIQLDIVPAVRPGEKAQIIMEPVTDYVRIVNGLTSGRSKHRSAITVRYADPRTLDVRGPVEPGTDGTIKYVAMMSPAWFGAWVLRETLAAGGITVKGDLSCARNCPKTVAMADVKKGRDWAVIDVYRSPPLKEIIKVVNKLSNNLYAEMLLLAIGRSKGLTGSEESIAAALDALRSAGIDTTGMVMADGSGLSRNNILTPNGTARLLNYMARSPYGASFTESLPVMSIDGTLGKRMRGSAAEGRVAAKTGTMANVRSLSGYVTTMGNERLSFVILSNNGVMSSVDSVTHRILLRLLRHRSPGE